MASVAPAPARPIALDVRSLPRTRPWYTDVWIRMLRRKPLGTIGGAIVLVMLLAAALADRILGDDRRAFCRVMERNIELTAALYHEPVPLDLMTAVVGRFAAFVRAKGRILSREQLIQEAWGPNTFVSDRVVDNHIGSLRKKLEPDASEPRHLHNVRGLGYRLDA